MANKLQQCFLWQGYGWLLSLDSRDADLCPRNSTTESTVFAKKTKQNESKITGGFLLLRTVEFFPRLQIGN